MSTFFKALQKAGLIEMDNDAETGGHDLKHSNDQDFFAADQEIATPNDTLTEAAIVPPPRPQTAGSAHKTPSERAKPLEFSDIYQSAALPPTPFSAEKMLKVLDGLQALEPAARKAAVLALDAAEDSWSINDVLTDASSKVKVLSNAKLHVEATAREILELTKEQIADTEKKLVITTNSIKQQISDLEGLLHREIAKVAEHKATLEAGAQKAKVDCQRELDRYQTEIQRLQSLNTVFGTVKTSTP